jgi:uridine phosphorylase
LEKPQLSPLLEHDVAEPPVFVPGNLLEGARRQKGLGHCLVPAGCLLDMDGELVERLVATGRAEVDESWPCFHTKLYRWRADGVDIGVVGGTVGAPFAVLVAEELFASGCEALVTMTSAGRIGAAAEPPFFVVIDRALRDEGTSHHYLAPTRYVEGDASLNDAVYEALTAVRTPIVRGASWTTDAPFRETEALIESRRREGVVCVEMEAAALLAMSSALRKRVVCLAHVTNEMATRPDDFEKGGHGGQEEALEVCTRAVATVVGAGGR